MAQCQNCGSQYGPGGAYPGPSPYGPVGPRPVGDPVPGPVVGPVPGYSVLCNGCSQVGPCGPCESCGHWCQYYSEQERMANDFCRDCCFNWGYQHTMQNALTPRFAPRWHVTADALFLLRDGDRYDEFATLGPRTTNGANVVLDANDLPECFESGFKASISRELFNHDNLLIEAAYLGFHEWGEHADFTDPGVAGTIASPFTNFGHPIQVPGLDFNDFAMIQFTSELESAEINLRHRCGLMCGALESSMVCGIRYMRIDETFQYQAMSSLPTPGGATNQVDVTTNNDLLGATLGVLTSWRLSTNWWIEADFKATMCGNTAHIDSLYTRNVNGVPGAFQFGERHNCVAVIGDLNIMTMYQIHNNIAVRAGYQMIWVDGIAVALENFNSNLDELTMGPALVNDNGTLVYHGPHLGLILTW